MYLKCKANNRAAYVLYNKTVWVYSALHPQKSLFKYDVLLLTIILKSVLRTINPYILVLPPLNPFSFIQRRKAIKSANAYQALNTLSHLPYVALFSFEKQLPSFFKLGKFYHYSKYTLSILYHTITVISSLSLIVTFFEISIVSCLYSWRHNCWIELFLSLLRKYFMLSSIQINRTHSV